MNLVLLCHPPFMDSQSMPRFARMLQSAFLARGHTVTLWAPRDGFHRRFANTRLAKWAGYVDQYLLFPAHLGRAARSMPPDTLFVFCDQALGPWMPLLRHRPHVVHVHDLLALRSALGDLPENTTRFTGRLYQRYIRRGFRSARHFISVSRKTRDDLHRFGGVHPETSEVVYNGLNYPYAPLARAEADHTLRAAGFPEASAGVLLHVGGSQWYKNQRGVIALYARYAAEVSKPLPLWCISPKPPAALQAALSRVPANGRVAFFPGVDERTLQAAYSHAAALLFPSLAEGFGWPLIEAQACGCAVVTTDEPPMNEVAGDAAMYLPRLRLGDDLDAWAAHGARVLIGLLGESDAERQRRSARGRLWAGRFGADRAIEDYLRIYQRILDLGVSGGGDSLTMIQATTHQATAPTQHESA
jgi:glycosyltransferase involved in cell wall biosynthesis